MIESTILSSLVFSEDFARKSIPYLNREYFQQPSQQVLFKLIKDHFSKYNRSPTKQSLEIDLQASKLDEKIFDETAEQLQQLAEPTVDPQWLLDSTEDFCKKRSLYNAIVKAAKLVADNDTSKFGQAHKLVQDALGVSFDTNLGHDYIDDLEERIAYHQRRQDKISCGLQGFNNVTLGGFLRPSMAIALAPTGVGKSMFLCQFAADFLMLGFNVLYITLEMPEVQVATRIDANLLDIEMAQMEQTLPSTFRSRINKLKTKGLGRLKIKEYPAHTAHSGHFRFLINEYIQKHGFKPDVIIVDYIGICASALADRSRGMYEYGGSVAVELRSLGQEFNAFVMSAVQVNREGTKGGDFESTDVAESWGIPHSTDYIYGLIASEELEAVGQMKIKRLKDRHNSPLPTSFLIGLDRPKMRMYDIDENVQVEQEQHARNEDREFNSRFDQFVTSD